MLHPVPCQTFVSVFLVISFHHKIVFAKTQFLFNSEKGVVSALQHNYRLSHPRLKEPINTVPQDLQDLQVGTNGDKDVIHIVDPPAFAKNHRIPYYSSQDTPTNFAKVTGERHLMHNYPLNTFEKHRPSAAFLIQPESPNANELLAPHQEGSTFQPHQHYKQTKKAPLKFGHFNNGAHPTVPQLHPFYPFQVSAAVRHKEIVRKRPAASFPHAKQRVRKKKLNTFQSKMLHSSSDFEEETEHTLTRKTRARRDVNSRKKSAKLMRGSLLPVALTIMGENGELLTGRALLQHITVLLKNASSFESSNEDEDSNKFTSTNGDVLLSQKDFHRIMDNSMNLTDPVMLTVLGLNALNDSSLLTNTYVNEYLNCIDALKIANRFQALQTKIDCMKRKLFDKSNFDSSDSSRYSISKLPAALVYADVMSNIKNLVRPKNGIAFYSLPVDELTHLQQVVLPIEEYVSQIHSEHFAPRSYHNRKFFFNENTHPRMPIWYIVKPDGRIYQTEGGRTHHPATIYHGFPDIPNADVFVDAVPHGSFFESAFYDE